MKDLFVWLRFYLTVKFITTCRKFLNRLTNKIVVDIALYEKIIEEKEINEKEWWEDD